MALLFFLIVMIGLGLIGWRFGADSRTGRDWQPYRLPGETVDS
jgi:Na+/proline symporter